MQYKNLYDQMLDEVYEDEYDAAPDWMKNRNTPAEAMEDGDPVMYRCGFADWLQEDNLEGVMCSGCGDREIDTEYAANSCDMDDEVLCPVCAGIKFECDGCNELFDTDEGKTLDDLTLCKECYVSEMDDREDEE